MSSDEQTPQEDQQSGEDKDYLQEGEPIDEGELIGGDGNEPEQASQQDPIATLEEQLQEAKDQTLRVQAEMQNLRRRVDRDIENAHKYALENFLGELLPVVDNLERGLATINSLLDGKDEAQKAIGEGIELTLKSFVDVLTRNKVEQIDPGNETFDPEFHQAMTMVPHPEIPANTVIEVFQKGYLLNGRLVRPAMVIVSRGAES
ncbi:MAG: nucleotide exchange factor GrpE [Porticoccaceae bacterium]|nr:nucleotide exchange factor GrpE [Porticoccaceae bacterium]